MRPARTSTLSSFKGKTILLNLWATWCEPCREEMPALNRLQHDLGSDKFEVVALSLDRKGYDASRKFLDDLKANDVKLYADATAKQGMELRAHRHADHNPDQQGRTGGRATGGLGEVGFRRRQKANRGGDQLATSIGATFVAGSSTPGRSANYFFLTFCVSADAAADLAALLAVLLRKILEREEATLALVVSVLPFCVRADAATDFSAFVADLLLRTFEAAVATFLLVLSDFAMDIASLFRGPQRYGPTRRHHARFECAAESREWMKASNFSLPSPRCFAGVSR